MKIVDVTPPRPADRPPEKITSVWMFVTTDPRDGSEGIVAQHKRHDALLVGADDIAKASGRKIEVRKFSGFEVIATIGGGA